MKAIRQLVVSYIGLMVASAGAGAVPAPWCMPNYLIPNLLQYSNGQSDYGRFGHCPEFRETELRFFPQDFRATASSAAGQTVTDRLSFQVNAIGAQPIYSLDITSIVGSYNISSSGRVDVEAFLFLTNLDLPTNPGNPLAHQLLTTPTFPIELAPGSSTGGEWRGDAHIDLPNGWRRMNVVFNLTFQASGNATVGVSPGAVDFRFNVPEPAMLIAAPFIFLFHRARR